MSNIVLINDNIKIGVDHITNVALVKIFNKNTYPIIYNETTDTYDSIFEKYQSLLNDPSNNIETINHVVVVFYPTGISCETFTFLEKEETMLLSKYIHNEKETTNVDDGEIQEPLIKSLNNLQTWTSFKVFIQKFNVQKSLDFLGICNRNQSNWKYILSELGTEKHLNFIIRLTDENTNNLKVAGDLILDYDNENFIELYLKI